jgi:peptide/nickel transport system substrate-binding protein
VPTESPEPSESPAASPSASAAASPATSAPPAPEGPPAPLEFRFFGDPVTLTETYRTGDLDIACGLPASAAEALADSGASRLARYPRATLTAIALNLRPAHPAVRNDRVRRALLKIVDREALIDDVAAGLAVRADSLIPPSSWAFSAKASMPVEHDRNGAAAELQDAGWRKEDGKWYPKGAKEPFTIELITPDGESNPVLLRTAEEVARQWTSFGIATTVLPMAPNLFVSERIRPAKFEAAAVDVVVGLDPDLYPLLGSRQAGEGGSNISGFQNLDLDKRLVAARKPGTEDARRKAYASVQEYLATAQVMLPLYWRDEPVVISDRVTGPAAHLLADPSDRFWDVLDWRLALNR